MGSPRTIITDLSRFRDLFVIARNSTFVYKDKPTDVRQIARELGVQYVLEGSLQTDGDRVRITAQLIDAATGNHVWSERYDRPLGDVFAIQDEVTHTIAASLAGVHGIVARARREMARRKPPENLQAYEYYTLGMEHKHQFTEQDNKKARELFQKALQLDPNFARAYVGLAWTHNLDIDFGWAESRQQSLDHWVAAARRAIVSDPYEEARPQPALSRRRPDRAEGRSRGRLFGLCAKARSSLRALAILPAPLERCKVGLQEPAGGADDEESRSLSSVVTLREGMPCRSQGARSC
jgi:tetratricopeptide (TPR) repeat protein